MSNNARAWLTGTPENPVINLDLPSGPRGAKGDKGDKGDIGNTPNVSVGNVVSVANPGDDAWLSQLLRSGSASQQAIRDTMPTTFKGDKGDPGGWNVGTYLYETHLDTVTTPGLYKQSTVGSITTANGYPAGVSGSPGRGVLKVTHWGSTTAVMQEYLTVGSSTRPGLIYQRRSDNGVWDPWTVTAHSQAGTDAIGFKSQQLWDATSGAWVDLPNKYPLLLDTTHDLNNITISGSYRSSGATSHPDRNYPTTANGILSVESRLRPGEQYGPSVIQTYEPVWGTPAREGMVFWRRTLTGGVWSPWRTFTSQRVDNTAGRVVYTWDETQNREQMIHADTGSRNIADMIDTTKWRVVVAKLRRQNSEVELRLQIYPLDNVTGTDIDVFPAGVGIPSGFRNQHTMQGTAVNGSTVRTWEIAYTGTYMKMREAGGGFMVIKWQTTDTWPTVLPGTADGSPPWS